MGILAGFGGALLIFLWTVTTHYNTHKNENLLVFPLLHFWLMGPGLKLLFKARMTPTTGRLITRYLIAALGIIGVDLLLKIGPFIQHNYEFIAFAVILNVAAILFVRVIEKSGDFETPPSSSSPSSSKRRRK